MLKALRDFSAGDAEIARGDFVSREVQEALPPRRLEALKSARYVEEITDEQELTRALEALQERVERLEARVEKLAPSRRRKSAA